MIFVLICNVLLSLFPQYLNYHLPSQTRLHFTEQQDANMLKLYTVGMIDARCKIIIRYIILMTLKYSLEHYLKSVHQRRYCNCIDTCTASCNFENEYCSNFKLRTVIRCKIFNGELIKNSKSQPLSVCYRQKHKSHKKPFDIYRRALCWTKRVSLLYGLTLKRIQTKGFSCGLCRKLESSIRSINTNKSNSRDSKKWRGNFCTAETFNRNRHFGAPFFRSSPSRCNEMEADNAKVNHGRLFVTGQTGHMPTFYLTPCCICYTFISGKCNL